MSEQDLKSKAISDLADSMKISHKEAEKYYNKMVNMAKGLILLDRLEGLLREIG